MEPKKRGFGNARSAMNNTQPRQPHKPRAFSRGTLVEVARILRRPRSSVWYAIHRTKDANVIELAVMVELRKRNPALHQPTEPRLPLQLPKPDYSTVERLRRSKNPRTDRRPA